MPHPRILLQQAGIRPKKSLGQNFLFDDNILQQIAGAAELSPADQVLEIGAGLGHLTRHLALQAGRVVALEVDQRLLPLLRSQLAGMEQVTILHQDILALDLAACFAGSPYKVVANIPYYLSGAILRTLLSATPRPQRLVLTVQQEVAERLLAGPGEMSLLGLSVQFYSRVRLVGQVKAGSFWPRPKMDSAIVRLDVKGEGEAGVAEEDFFRVARAGFAQKRKQLKNNLGALGRSQAEIAAALEQAGIVPQRRAETLSLAEWVALTRALFRQPPGR